MAKGLRKNARLPRSRPGGVVPGDPGQGQAAERPARSARSIDGRSRYGRFARGLRDLAYLRTHADAAHTRRPLPGSTRIPLSRKLFRGPRWRRWDAADGLG